MRWDSCWSVSHSFCSNLMCLCNSSTVVLGIDPCFNSLIHCSNSFSYMQLWVSIRYARISFFGEVPFSFSTADWLPIHLTSISRSNFRTNCRQILQVWSILNSSLLVCLKRKSPLTLWFVSATFVEHFYSSLQIVFDDNVGTFRSGLSEPPSRYGKCFSQQLNFLPGILRQFFSRFFLEETFAGVLVQGLRDKFVFFQIEYQRFWHHYRLIFLAFGPKCLRLFQEPLKIIGRQVDASGMFQFENRVWSCLKSTRFSGPMSHLH